MKYRAAFLLSLMLFPALAVSGCADRAAEPASTAAAPEQRPGASAQPAPIAEEPTAAATSSPDEGLADSSDPFEVAKSDNGGGATQRPVTATPASPAFRPRPESANAPPAVPKPKDLGGIGGKPRVRAGRGDKAGERGGDGKVLAPDRGETARNMYFQHYGVNPTIDTEEEARSTFAVDVDTASYTMTRSYLERGQLPAEAAVRVEEMINAFNYGYEAPASGTFSVHAEAAPSPNRKGYHVLHVGVKGKEISKSERKAATLVFVVDVSGSMDADNRLGLVKKSLGLLVGQLEEGDKVGIVTYGSEARELLQPTSAFNKQRIMQVIDNLRTEGATNAEAGLRMGYAMASKHMGKDRISRVILCSDGVANVGLTGPNGLLDTIKAKAKEGITISTVGFGMGNYNDVLMERLADGGNGNYHYVDKLDEARRVFVEQLTGTLQVIAKDTKIQIEFDPKVVSRYRLIGYENRSLTAREFGDDRVDAGEIGAGHAVTAVYEIKLRDGHSGNLGKVRIRHKEPNGSESQLIERDLPQSIVKANSDELTSPTQLSLVVAQFAEKLRGSYWARNVSYDDILRRFERISAPLRSDPKVVELRKLVLKAKQLDTREDKFEKHGPVALMSFDRVPVLK